MSTEAWILNSQFEKNWLWMQKRVYSGVEAWIDILLQANHEKTTIKIKNRTLIVERGEVVQSLENWGKRWRWSKSRVQRFIEILKKEKMIDTVTDTVSIRLKVLSNETYKDSRYEKNTVSDTVLVYPKLEISEDGLKFANWFKGLLPKTQKITDADIKSWGKTFDQLVRIDKRDRSEICAVVKWARKDDFWQKQFLSANKLRTKDKTGTLYYDVFLNHMKIKKETQLEAIPNKTLEQVIKARNERQHSQN
jgi:hypothetical protein